MTDVRDPVIRPEEAIALAEAGGATFLDVRWALGRTDGHEQYLAGHIPSAAFVDLETDLAAPVGDGSRGRHPLPDPETFAAAMRRVGVRMDRPVVVYDDVAGTSAARAWWLLEHHGHDALVVHRLLQAVGDVPKQGLLELAPIQFRQGPVQGTAGQLLHQLPGRIDHEGAGRRDLHGLPHQGRHHDPEDQQQQDEVEDPAERVQAQPEGLNQAAEEIQDTHGPSLLPALLQAGDW